MNYTSVTICYGAGKQVKLEKGKDGKLDTQLDGNHGWA